MQDFCKRAIVIVFVLLLFSGAPAQGQPDLPIEDTSLVPDIPRIIDPDLIRLPEIRIPCSSFIATNSPLPSRCTPFWTQITAGEGYTCGVTYSSGTYCWGANGEGQLGNGIGGDIGDQRTEPVKVKNVAFQQVDAGFDHVCGVTRQGDAYCWGDNHRGELGDGTDDISLEPEPVNIPGGTKIFQISAGSDHTCAVPRGRSGPAAYCWGNNSEGQIGASNLSYSLDPVSIRNAAYADEISSGRSYTCSIMYGGSQGNRRQGKLFCWGRNAQGQFGNGSQSGYDAPTAIDSGVSFVSIAGSQFSTCGLVKDGSVYCFGYNGNGQLGIGNRSDQIEPLEEVSGGHTFVQISGGRGHNCGVTEEGSAFCWGDDDREQLGNGPSSNSHSVPVEVMGDYKFRQVSAGQDHTCAVTTDGNAFCWGDNQNGELGNGTTASVTSPEASPVEVKDPVN